MENAAQINATWSKVKWILFIYMNEILHFDFTLLELRKTLLHNPPESSSGDIPLKYHFQFKQALFIRNIMVLVLERPLAASPIKNREGRCKHVNTTN